MESVFSFFLSCPVCRGRFYVVYYSFSVLGILLKGFHDFIQKVGFIKKSLFFSSRGVIIKF